MASNAYDFGVVERLQANAVGLPGQRTFRLRLLNQDAASASLWIEKEQLQALGNAIDQLMAQLSDDNHLDLLTREPPDTPADLEAEFPMTPQVEFKIGRLALGFDEAQTRFTLLVHDVESEQPNLASAADFRCLVTREQLQNLSQQIEVVVNAGRPRCPLCGRPLTVGTAHFCPPSNGHAPVVTEEE